VTHLVRANHGKRENRTTWYGGESDPPFERHTKGFSGKGMFH